MFLSIIILLVCLFTSLFVYFIEYRGLNDILYWSIPLYMLISLIIVIILFFFVIWLICLDIKKGEFVEKPKKATYTLIRMVARFIVTFYRLKVDVRIECDLPKDDNYLLVGNHQSMLDPIITIGMLKKLRFAFIMKDGVMKLPFIGKFLYKGGFLPLDRKNNRKGLETIIHAINRIENGYAMAVYPEGTRSKDTYVAEFKPGIFKVIQKAKCDMLIVTVDNNYEIKHRWPFKSTKVLLKVSKYIKYDDLKDLQTSEIGEIVKNTLDSDIESYRNEKH